MRILHKLHVGDWMMAENTGDSDCAHSAHNASRSPEWLRQNVLKQHHKPCGYVCEGARVRSRIIIRWKCIPHVLILILLLFRSYLATLACRRH